jgi:hypothetical protein
MPLERSDVRNIERVLGVKVIYRELPPLPRPIGLISDTANIATLPSTGSGQPARSPAARPFARSFSPGRRRSGRR